MNNPFEQGTIEYMLFNSIISYTRIVKILIRLQRDGQILHPDDVEKLEEDLLAIEKAILEVMLEKCN